jgi:SAM-dependent methyltransferase
MHNLQFSHRHIGIIGIAGLCVAALLFAIARSWPAAWSVALWTAPILIAVGALALLSVYLLMPSRIKRHFSKRAAGARETPDFGWSLGAMNGYWMTGGVCVALAVLMFIQSPSAPGQLLSLGLGLLALNLFAGSYVWRTSKDTDHMTLPFVDLLASDHDLILDAGCGSGRTTLALSRIMKNGSIVALDLFTADYIQGGGQTLLERNLKVAGLTDRVQIVKGDITQLEFEDNHFDAAASAYMMDHLGEGKLPALKEVRRTLKPGGRFLLVVLEPNVYTFAVANLMCLAMASRKVWKGLFRQAQLTLLQEGAINGGVYFLLKK